MIDWIKIELFCNHKTPINGDTIACVDPDGLVKWSTKAALGVVGSFDTRIQVRTLPRPIRPIPIDFGNNTHTISVEGNFVKFFQGHNVDGTNNLRGLILHMMDYLVNECPELELNPTELDKKGWLSGNIKIKRVDITESFDLGTDEAVESWLKGTTTNAQVAYKGRSVYTQGTVYFGKNSRHWSMKFYNKYSELKAKGHRLPEEFHSQHEKMRGILRGELVFRIKKLEKLGLEYLNAWQTTTPFELYEEYIGKMMLGSRIKVSSEELDNMPRGLRSAYILWKDGNDVTQLYSRAQMYRIKKGLLEYGIDVTACRPTKAEVIPLVTYVHAKSWHAGKEWELFEPSEALKK